MPRTRTHTFGPGSLESLTLKTWVGKKDGDLRRWHAKLEGRYTVYCGNGWEHDVEIDISESAWSTDPIGREITLLDAGESSALEFVDNMINWSLEDWEDPCDDLEDEL